MEMQQTNTNTNTKRHYHLLMGEVVFQILNPQDPALEGVDAVRVNGILADESKQIPVRLLAKAQQLLQANFFQTGQVTPETVKVLNVIISGIMYLGEFTSEEFQQQPEGMQKQERPSAPVTTMPKPVKPASLEEALAGAKQN